jgi:hypothetical protein
VTVCIAAIADGPMIFCAADRMITVGDIQYEPNAPKIYEISNSIYLMPSGSFELQSEMIRALQMQAREWIDENPGSWPSVEDFADRYNSLFSRKRYQKWEAQTLRREGYTAADVAHLAPDIQNRLLASLSDDLLGDVWAILFGMEPVPGYPDTMTAHLWVAHNDDKWDCTLIGFAAIGIGARHAETQISHGRAFSKHAPD